MNDPDIRNLPAEDEAHMPAWQRAIETVMALCLAVMAAAVFVNVVLRYGFGSGIAASEELSRLLFVWLVFIGAVVAYPRGEHMAFTGVIERFQRHPAIGAVVARVIHLLVVGACAMLAWGAWQQVVVGMESRSVVLGYPVALLPLPALLCAVAIGLMAVWNLITGRRVGATVGTEAE